MIHIPDSIFPVNDKGEKICSKCRLVLDRCSCPSYDPAAKVIEQCSPQINLDKSGRAGKVVTMVTCLPQDKVLLKKLCAKLKIFVGSGGTFYIHPDMKGVVEIQGDKRILIEEVLYKEGFRIG